MKHLIPLVILTGCAALPPPAQLPPQSEDTCQAANYANLVGLDATALERTLLLGKVRVIRPGDLVTMDFLSDRINFMIDADNRIATINCG